jgi:hypothetical protein
MSMYDDLYIVGSAWSPVTTEIDLQLDELVFDTCSQALHEAGVLRHQIGLSVTSSLDLYDARSISSALTAPAAAGYLTDELRVEGDSGAALMVAAAGLASGSVDYALVVALHVPEVGSVRERDIRQIDEHVSSYTFDSHTDRPVGMTASATLGMHASTRIDDGVLSFDDMAASAAADITRGASRRGTRAAVDAAGVRRAPMAASPLTELMLPAASAGVGVVVLAVGVAGRRCPNPLARIAGWGRATALATSNPQWLQDPCAATAIAREQAFTLAGMTDPLSRVEVVEMTDLSPALSNELLRALDLDGIDPEKVNRSGGVRSNHPGIANGVLRVAEATQDLAHASADAVAVVHTTDHLCGLVSSTSTVLVLEAP